jgi:hypothetical protein
MYYILPITLLEEMMELVKGDFVKGSAVVYKKENGFIIKGLQFQDSSTNEI